MPTLPVALYVGAAAVFAAAVGLLWVTQGREVFLAMMASALASCF